MAEVVVIGAGLSGTLMAYELLPQLRKDDRVSVISQGAVYHFVPSNPFYERFLLDKLNINKIKEIRTGT
ncbi:FAD-binding oxidoreductase [Bradyrhizobium sp. 35]|uniref:hypothetical protein n=1 Tax=Bradyrhizobium sp. 35 TaxID=2782670 RepID=UPI001FFB1353|nr:hypothetical protein [Bradyrhizobium sp. 35]MCK1453633.1 FAD-binding oxidoreductase [Bradyrhizobium sp. 35]